MRVIGVMAALRFESWLSTLGVMAPGLVFAAELLVPSSFPRIQDAIDAASNGDTVSIAAGVYYGAGNVNLDPGGREILVRGTGATTDATILDGAGTSRIVYVHSGEGRELRFENLTLYRGAAPVNSYGGGIFVGGASSPTVLRCRFVECTASLDGGGAALLGAALLEECEFMHCSAPSGSAISIISAAAIEIRKCLFVANISSGGGTVLLAGSDALLDECTISGNTAAGRGGGLYVCCGHRPTVRSCTIVGNASGLSGGGIYSRAADLLVERSIIAFNCGDGVGDAIYMEALDYTKVTTLDCCAVDPGDVWAPFPHVVNYVGDVVTGNPGMCHTHDCEESPNVDANVSLRDDSPCLPLNNGCGVLIGADSAGCTAAGVSQPGVSHHELRTFVVEDQVVRMRGRVEVRSDRPGLLRLELISVGGGRLATSEVRIASDGVGLLEWPRDLGLDDAPPRGVYLLLAPDLPEARAAKLVVVGR